LVRSEVRRVKLRDRGTNAESARISFTSSILPKWARRTKSLDALLPVLYLRGISTGDFQEALAALLGKDAPNLSPAMITRLAADCASSDRANEGSPVAEDRQAHTISTSE
jgi:transposase-like protein